MNTTTSTTPNLPTAGIDYKDAFLALAAEYTLLASGLHRVSEAATVNDDLNGAAFTKALMKTAFLDSRSRLVEEWTDANRPEALTVRPLIGATYPQTIPENRKSAVSLVLNEIYQILSALGLGHADAGFAARLKILEFLATINGDYDSALSYANRVETAIRTTLERPQRVPDVAQVEISIDRDPE